MTIMTEEARQIVQTMLYGEEPLTFIELIFRPGFIKIMTIVWSPVIIILIILYIIHKLEKKY